MFPDCGSVPHVARVPGGGQFYGGARIFAGTVAAKGGDDTHKSVSRRPLRLWSPDLPRKTLRGTGATPRSGQGQYLSSSAYKVYTYICQEIECYFGYLLKTDSFSETVVFFLQHKENGVPSLP